VAPQQAQEGLADVVVAGRARSSTHHDDIVAWLEIGATMSHGDTQYALDPVTPYGVRIHLAGDGQTQPGRPVSWQPVKGHQRFGHPKGAVEDRRIFGTRANPR